MPSSRKKQSLLLLLLLCAMACLPLLTCKEKGTPTKPSVRAALAANKPVQKELRLLTYNVLVDRDFQKLRTKALFQILRRTKADVIALQEADGWFVYPLLKQSWLRGKYHITRYKGRPFAPGGQFILSRYPIVQTVWKILPGRQRRTVVIARIRVDGRILAVATTHMESLPTDGPVRAKQLDMMFSMLAKEKDAVLMGDFNFGYGAQPETRSLPSTYQDLWLTLHKGKPGFTWNIPQNPLAKVGSFKDEKSSRIDRILLRSAHWKPKTIQIIGNRAIGQGRWYGRPYYHTGNKAIDNAHRDGLLMKVFPSDHYGLLGTIVTKGKNR